MITYPLRFLLILKEITMKAFSWAPPNAGTVPSVPMGEWAPRGSALCCAFSSGLCTGDKGVGLPRPSRQNLAAATARHPRASRRWNCRALAEASGTAGRRPDSRGPGRAAGAGSAVSGAGGGACDPLAPRRRGPGSRYAAHTTEGNAALGFFFFFPFSFAYNYSDGIIFFETNCP